VEIVNGWGDFANGNDRFFNDYFLVLTFMMIMIVFWLDCL